MLVGVGFLAGLVVKIFRRPTLKFLIPAIQDHIDEIKKKRKYSERERKLRMDIL